MQLPRLLAGLLTLAAPLAARADDAAPGTEPLRKPHFVSTSLFMIANLLPDPPKYVQLNYGRRVTERDTLLVEAITWDYPAPLGIPYGPAFEAPEFRFPGFVRGWGLGIAYQRFWWKGLFTTVHATPFLQTYHEPAGDRIRTGFQLFVVARVGYHIPLWRDRLWLEPSLAATSWPVNTNLPPGFRAEEDRWPRYFLGEPGLNVGVGF